MNFRFIVISAALISCSVQLANANTLPYWITIDSSSAKARTTLCLKDIVEATSAQWFKLPAKDRTLRRYQDFFEQRLFAHVDELAVGISTPTLHQLTQQATAKWLAHYSLDASVLSNRLDALQELLRSMQLLNRIQGPAMMAASQTFDEVRKQSQWCGAPAGTMDRPTGDYCSPGRLFKLSPHAEEKTELYQDLLDRIQSAQQGELSAEQIHVLSYQILWDPPLDRVRYGVTIFFNEDRSDGSVETFLIGHDLIYSNTATPAPAGPSLANPSPEKARPRMRAVADWANTASGYPIGLVIGVKNAAFELAKMPFSFIGGFLGRGHPYQYPWRNIQTAYQCLAMEIVHPPQIGLLHSVARLLGEIPLVGPVFQMNENPDRQGQTTPQKIYLTRGIYGGSELEQDTGLWLAAAHDFYPNAQVYAAPYEFGTITDVIWSMFDLSNGPAYTMARQVLRTANRSDRLYLVGHSAGVQRITMTSRLLNYQGYDVRQMIGVAGPSLGQAAVNMRRPEPFKLFLNPSEDIVSIVGLGARSVALIADIGIRRPIKLAGDIFLRWDRRRVERWDHQINRMGLSNAEYTQVTPGLPAKHETPFSLSLTTRVVFDRFIREEFQNAFRDDLSPSPQPDDEVISYEH